SEFVALRTSKEHVRRQLLMLAELSQDIPPIRDRGEHPRADYLPLPELRRRGLDLCGDMFTPEMSENLAEALHEVLSLALIHERDHGHAYYAGMSSRQALATLRQRIDRARQAVRAVGEPGAGQDEDEQAGKLFRLYEQLATYESLLSSQQSLERSADAGIPEGWDSESVQWMRVGDRVGAALGRTPSACGLYPGGDDFSPAAVCWSKAFE